LRTAGGDRAGSETSGLDEPRGFNEALFVIDYSLLDSLAGPFLQSIEGPLYDKISFRLNY